MGYGLTLTRAQCVDLILAHGLPEPKKSRCWMCPFMTNEEWSDQKEHEPDDHAKAIALDAEIAERDERGGIYVHHSGIPLSEADLTVPGAPEHPLFGRGETCNTAGCWT